MARFIPEVNPHDIAHDSERIVYQALLALPEGFVVLHSFPWLRPNRDLAGEPLREGEADFVVVHPDRGLLVLEVKGGNPTLDGRTWSRSGKMMRDPFEQARRNRYALLDSIEERTRHCVHRNLFTHGDVVVFPHARFEGSLPLNTDSRILIDAGGLATMPHGVEEAFIAWSRSLTHLSHAHFSQLLEALMPKLRLMRCAGSELRAEHHRIVQVTLDQRATLLGLLENDRVIVEGTAGSGKTLLALEFALARAERGEHALLLCFNRNLAEWLKEQASHDPRHSHSANRLQISTFHSFALALARRAEVEFEVPNTGAQDFWDSEVPLILEQALEVLRLEGRAPVFDVVVVDEAQDFAPDWWVTIESLTRHGRAGRLYAFLDLNQSLRGLGRVPPVPLPARFRLTTNCRSTKALARSAALLANLEVRLLPGSPAGESPAIRKVAAAAADAGIVFAEVRQLLRQGLTPQQVALIGPATHENGSLAAHQEIDDVPLVNDAGDWRRGGGILVTTARSFKGLEADVVILYGIGNFGPQFAATDLYVAWTRARHRLIVVCQSGDARRAVEMALAEAERMATLDSFDGVEAS
jgi:hypothetical protein